MYQRPQHNNHQFNNQSLKNHKKRCKHFRSVSQNLGEQSETWGTGGDGSGSSSSSSNSSSSSSRVEMKIEDRETSLA